MYKSQSTRGCHFLKVQHQDPDTALSIEYGGKKGAASVPDTDSEHTSDYKVDTAYHLTRPEHRLILDMLILFSLLSNHKKTALHLDDDLKSAYISEEHLDTDTDDVYLLDSIYWIARGAQHQPVKTMIYQPGQWSHHGHIVSNGRKESTTATSSLITSGQVETEGQSITKGGHHGLRPIVIGSSL